MNREMKNSNRIEKEVDRTLESLEGLSRAEANPYLFTRVKSRLEQDEKSIWSTAIGFIGKPAIAIAAILLLVILNASVALKSGSSPRQAGQEAEQIFASEYNLADTAIYDTTIDPE